MQNKQAKKVLIIEDNSTLTKLLESQLRSEEIMVINARDGEEGLDKIMNENPDLVILDIILPKKNGVQVLDELHKIKPKSNIPIIVLSNSDDMTNVAGAAAHNIAAYLFKSDQNIEAIVDMVRQKLGTS